MNIGIIGGGAIAKFLLKKDVNVKSLLVRNQEKHKALANTYNVDLYTKIDDFLSSEIDVVVEAASVEAVKQYLPKILQKRMPSLLVLVLFQRSPFINRALILLKNIIIKFIYL